MKAVGHGDCYVVIADGRIVVIDAGPRGETGLVSLLRSGYLHYDRIVITHVHSDHVGGLLTAAEYASQNDSHFGTDFLVSNHGPHDLDLIVNESRIPSLLASMRGRKEVVGLTDEALQQLALEDPHLRLQAISLPRESASENRSSLIVKVTEIRGETKRSILFLGDIESHEQQALLARPDVGEIFSDVGAVTLPHHGRQTTLWENFFREVKRVAGDETVFLHSDRAPLDPRVKALAEESAAKVLSTAPTSPRGVGQDVPVNLFQERTYLQVRGRPTTLGALVRTNFRTPVSQELTITERVSAVESFCGRKATELLPLGTIISVPTEEWIQNHAANVRAEYRHHTDELISLLQSRDENEVRRASRELSLRRPRLTPEQVQAILEIAEGGGETWRKDLGHPPDCPHKTIYEERTTGYYAASVIQQPGFGGISAADRNRATQARRNGYRRDVESDPGWL